MHVQEYTVSASGATHQEGEDMSQLLNIGQVAEMLNVSIPTLYRMTSQKRIPFIKLGQRVLFDPEKVAAWLAEHEQGVMS